MALITRCGVIWQFLKRFGYFLLWSWERFQNKSVFDREIAQALAVLQVAVIVVMILVKIELYGAIAKNSSFAISKSDSESEWELYDEI